MNLEKVYNQIKNSSREETEKYLLENVKKLLESIEVSRFFVFYYLRSVKLNEAIKQNFCLFLKKAGYRVDDFLGEFIDFYPGNREFVIENMENIISRDVYPNLTRVVRALAKEGKDIQESLNTILNNKKEILAEEILREYADLIGLKNEDQIIGCSKTLLAIFTDLMESENKPLSELEYIGEGSYSVVLGLGNKVIKVGYERQNYNMPNHRRILQPIMRSNYTINGKVVACFEVTTRARMLTDDEMNHNCGILYKIYKELRDDGIVWTDIDWENIGVLLEDNVTTLNGKQFEVDDSSVGFVSKKGGDSLKKGEVAIIDTDYIYRADDSNKEWVAGAERFEQKYQKEKMEEQDRKRKAKKAEKKLNIRKNKNSIEENEER